MSDEKDRLVEALKQANLERGVAIDKLIGDCIEKLKQANLDRGIEIDKLINDRIKQE